MMRLPVCSRRWNLVLAVLGSIYAVTAVILLAWYAREVWGSEGIIDRIFQAALLLSTVCGIWFAVSGLSNLGYLGNQKPWHPQRVNR